MQLRSKCTEACSVEALQDRGASVRRQAAAETNNDPANDEIVKELNKLVLIEELRGMTIFTNNRQENL